MDPVPPAPSMSTPPVTPLPEPKSKIWLLILAGVSLVGAGTAAGFFFGKQLYSKPISQPTPSLTLKTTPTPDPTTNWEVYTDSKLGYSIKYPKNTFTVKATPGTGIGINKGPLNGITIDFQILSRGPEVDPEVALKRETPTCGDAAKALSPAACNPTTENFHVNNAVGIRVTSHSGLDYYLTDLNKSVPVVRIIIGINKNDPDFEIFNLILSTFKFTDTEKVEAPVKNIVYKKTPGWTDFKSNTGYFLQIPSTFSDTDGSGEESRDGACFMFFGNNAGGIISAKVVPYGGGSRRELYGIQPGYNYSSEEILIQGKKSLIIEAGPIGDSGSGSGVVIPVGDHALIISWSNRAKSSAEFNSLLQSITLQSSLDISQCEK